eukprot:9014261-Ditylum_brightwellii.AAC.1
MAPQTRQELINTIDNMCATVSEGKKLWTNDRAKNPEVIDESVVNSADNEDASDDEDGKERNDVQGTSEDASKTDLMLFLLLPPSLVRELKNDRANKEISYKLFKHVTNHVVCKHWNNDVVKQRGNQKRRG